MVDKVVICSNKWLGKTIEYIDKKITEDGWDAGIFLWDGNISKEEFEEGYTQLIETLNINGVETIDIGEIISNNFEEFKRYVKDIEEGKNLQYISKIIKENSILEILEKSESLEEFLCSAKLPNPDYQEYKIPIGANVVFQRDPIFTFKYKNKTYAIPLNMNSARKMDTVLTTFALQKIGAEIIEVDFDESDRAEGGDFLYDEYKDVVLIGTGPRTHEKSARKVLKKLKKNFPELKIVLVLRKNYGDKITSKENMDLMHLDTYLGITPKCAVVYKDAVNFTVEIHEGNDIKYTKLIDFLKETYRNVGIFGKEEQQNFEFNLAVFGKKAKVFCKEGKIADWLKEKGEYTIPVDMKALNTAYGGIHCATREVYD